MVTLGDLKRVEDIPGVDRYIVLQPDGHPLLNTMEDDEAISRMITESTAMCKQIKGRRFRYLVVGRPCGEDFYIFQMGNYFLGVIKQPKADAGQMVEGVAHYFQELASL